MANTKSSKHYTSKGQRPNVSRKTRNAMRRERRANPALEDVFKRQDWRRMVIGRKGDPKLAHLREKYIEEDMVRNRAMDLFEKYKIARVTWGACVQAVKTNWVPQFEAKWSLLKNAQET